MTGMSAKPGQFPYYVCNTKRRKGKGLCKSPLLPKQKMESFVIERIRDSILTAETLEELARLVNEEIYQYKQEQLGGALLNSITNRRLRRSAW